MAAPRRMTRNIQIGLSHGERAKMLSYNGFYEEALKELNIALRAFEAENEGGKWDEAIANVLNNAGFVYLFIGDHHRSEDTFRSALAIKRRLGGSNSIASTLAGLADAYKGQCKFEESYEALEEALHEAMSAKDDNLARSLVAGMDTLERIRCDMPDAAGEQFEYDELYVPPSGSDVSARVSYLGVNIGVEDTFTIEADIGFPYLMRDLDIIDRSCSQQYPAMALLFPKGVESSLTGFTVTDEEETPVSSSSSPLNGIFFGPGSYHRNGPMPMPACKRYVFTYGAGYVLKWPITANGWYHVEAVVKVIKGIEGRQQLLVAMPFGSTRLKTISVSRADTSAWGHARLLCGSFASGRYLDTSMPAVMQERLLYDGPAKDMPGRCTGASLKYGILCLDLLK